MRLVLFDIDGTLLWTDGAGRRAIHRALLDETGAGPVEGYRFDGKTDPQIVRELMQRTRTPERDVDASMAAVLDRYLALLEAELARPAHATRLLPGVRELLDALAPVETEGGALVGLLTGNLARGATLKLRSAGLDPGRFAVGAFGSDSERRSDLPPVAARRAAARAGRPFAGRDLVIIGDTPADMACGAPLGARAVGVATGFYDTATLTAAGAAAVFADLSDTAAVLTAILAP